MKNSKSGEYLVGEILGFLLITSIRIIFLKYAWNYVNTIFHAESINFWQSAVIISICYVFIWIVKDNLFDEKSNDY